MKFWHAIRGWALKANYRNMIFKKLTASKGFLKFVYGISGLPDGTSLFTLIISILYMALFIWHQSRVKHPLISMRLFTENKVFPFSLAASSLMYSAMYPLGFILSIFLQFAKGLSPSDAGTILLLQAITMAIIGPIAGRVSDRFEARVISTLGCCVCLIAFTIVMAVDETTPSWVIGVCLVCIGLGFGFFSTPNNSAAMGAVNESELGTASAAVNLSRTVGNLIGMSLMMLTIHTIIGPVQFTPELNKELVETLHIWMKVAAVFAVLAGVMSLARGRTLAAKRSIEITPPGG